MRRILNSSTSPSKYVTETHVHKVLFILAMGLREAESSAKKDMINKADRGGIWEMVEKLVSQDPKDLPEHVKMLASWIVGAVKNFNKDGNASMDTGEAGGDVTAAEQLRKRRADAAAARKAKIMAQMTAMQKNFAAENATILDGLEEDNKADMETSQVEL